MFVAVLAAETDETRQAITMLILGLVGIAVLLSLLTVWYWRFTSPKRRAVALFEEMNRSGSDSTVDAVEAVDDLFEPTGVAPEPGGDQTGADDVRGSNDTDVDAEGVDADGDRHGAERPDADGPGQEPIPAHLALVSVIDGAAEAAQRIDGGTEVPTFDAIIPSGAWLDAWAPEADDELTRARRRRSSRQDVLSDDDWAAAMRSAFDHYRP